MAIELQEAPAVGVVETVHADGLEDIPDMVAHAYWLGEGSGIALCGLPETHDPHAQMERAKGVTCHTYPLNTEKCDLCGAPICATCLAVTRKGRKGE